MIEIWMEGFSATGQSSVAQKIGEYKAENFDEAIKKYKEDYPKVQVDEHQKGHYSIWGCKLFDNESDARKSFG